MMSKSIFIILNIFALVITLIWAFQTVDLEPVAGSFVLLSTLLTQLKFAFKSKLKVYYKIQKSGISRLAGGPSRREFKIILGVENTNRNRSASNVILQIISGNVNFIKLREHSLEINPKDKIDVLESKRLILLEDSQNYDNIKISYQISCSNSKTIERELVIPGSAIIATIL